jgi:hypothetical protein
MKKLLLLFVFSFCIVSFSQAQYKSAVGLRLGYPTSISYKQFLNDANAIELFGGLYYNDLAVGANLSIHKDIDAVDNLRWYYGAGAVVGLYNNFGSSGVSVGVSGNLGLDYAFDDFPLNLSIDIVPTFFILGSKYSSGYLSGFDGFGALSARYILGSKN